MFFYIIDAHSPGGGAVSGQTSIGLGATSVAVVFSAPFTGTPAITVSVGVPDGEDLIYATVQKSSVTANGFTALLSSSTNSANYTLYWEAATP